MVDLFDPNTGQGLGQQFVPNQVVSGTETVLSPTKVRGKIGRKLIVDDPSDPSGQFKMVGEDHNNIFVPDQYLSGQTKMVGENHNNIFVPVQGLEIGLSEKGDTKIFDANVNHRLEDIQDEEKIKKPIIANRSNSKLSDKDSSRGQSAKRIKPKPNLNYGRFGQKVNQKEEYERVKPKVNTNLINDPEVVLDAV